MPNMFFLNKIIKVQFLGLQHIRLTVASQDKAHTHTQSITCSRFPERGSMSLIFRSLQVVAKRLPSVLKDMERTTSVWWLMVRTGFFITASGQSRFQIITCRCHVIIISKYKDVSNCFQRGTYYRNKGKDRHIVLTVTYLWVASVFSTVFSPFE